MAAIGKGLVSTGNRESRKATKAVRNKGNLVTALQATRLHQRYKEHPTAQYGMTFREFAKLAKRGKI
jgi:hypothetical protein